MFRRYSLIFPHRRVFDQISAFPFDKFTDHRSRRNSGSYRPISPRFRVLIGSFPNPMHAKNYEYRSTSSEDIRSFFHIGVFLIRSRHFRSINLLIIDHVVTLQVTGRSRPDFACLSRHFVSICPPKIIEIVAVHPKEFTHFSTLGFRICFV